MSSMLRRRLFALFGGGAAAAVVAPKPPMDVIGFDHKQGSYVLGRPFKFRQLDRDLGKAVWHNHDFGGRERLYFGDSYSSVWYDELGNIREEDWDALGRRGRQKIALKDYEPSVTAHLDDVPNI